MEDGYHPACLERAKALLYGYSVWNTAPDHPFVPRKRRRAMLLTDYFMCERDRTWDFAKQCGIRHGVIRLPEEQNFDITNRGHWETVCQKFMDFGICPVVVEPLPEEYHRHIKTGDSKRDECIEKVIRMLEIMDALDVRTLCFNFMAHIGWLRTSSTVEERGGAFVTGFRMRDFVPDPEIHITEEELWKNYRYFIKAVLPAAEKHGIRLALHPDDPPVARLGNVSRILTSLDKMDAAINIRSSPCLGVALCQATFVAMGEDLTQVIPRFARENKLFFVHFRDIVGDKYDFHESFHDNGQTDMAAVMRLYRDCGVDVPIRVDHVPTMAGEPVGRPGYDALGRLYAIGYLRGIHDAVFTA